MKRKPIWNLIEKNLEQINDVARHLSRGFGRLSDYEADELTQMAVMRILEISEKKQLEFLTDEHFVAWVRLILKNVAYEQYKRRREETNVNDECEQIAAPKDLSQIEPNDEQPLELFRRCVASLPLPYRIVIELISEGLTPIEIAEFLEISHGVFRKRLSRAKFMLKKLRSS